MTSNTSHHGSPVTVARPVRGSERLTHVDALRGVALLGILVVNLLAFSGPSFTFVRPLSYWDGADRWVEWAILITSEGAFYTIFSVLLGWGFGRWMRTRGTEATGRFMRRLGWLLAIGLVHLFGVWTGDILVQYALTAFLLLPFAAASVRIMVGWAAGLWIAGVLLFASGPGDISRGSAARWVALYSDGSFGEIFSARLEQGVQALSGIIVYVPIVLALFLLGAALAKARAFGDVVHPGPVRNWCMRSLILTLPAGVTLKAIYAADLLAGDASRRLVLSTTTGGPLLGLAYVALFTLWFTGAEQRAWSGALQTGLAAAGRMALTVYVTQSVIMTLLFFGYGLGLYGSVGPAIGLPIALGVFLVQVAFATWWLARFRFGPLEWAWRSLTYGEFQPFRTGS